MPIGLKRKLVLSLGMSLDGYIARPDGSVDFLFLPKDFSMAPFMERIDTVAMGRKTYDVAMQMGGPAMGPSTPAYVFSRSAEAGKRGPVTFVRQSPLDFIAEIRKTEGKDIWLMGGGELAKSFLEADLVDEVHLGIVPSLLGGGIALFPRGFAQRDFELVENKSYSKGLVTLQYQRRRSKKKS